MQTVLIVIHLMVVLSLVVVVLLQRSEGGALGVGGGSGFMTGRGQANVLTRATAILATLFFLTSLSLTILANYSHSNKSILEGILPSSSGSSAPAPALLPKGQGTVFDQLRKIEQQRAGTQAPDSQTPAVVPAPATPAPVTPAPAKPPVASAPAEPVGVPSKPADAVTKPADAMTKPAAPPAK